MGTYEKMIEVVKNWDPFQMGPEFYETEASDVVNVISVFDDQNTSQRRFNIYTLCLLRKYLRLKNVRN